MWPELPTCIILLSNLNLAITRQRPTEYHCTWSGDSFLRKGWFHARANESGTERAKP